ncbi:MAG: phosphodiesterase, partial [Bacillota bacterium]
MRRISVDKLETGMCVAKNVYGLDGRILLASGLALKPQYIQRLRELEIPAIYVEDERTAGLEVPDVISEQMRLEANITVKDVMRRVEGGQPLQIDRVKRVVN